MRLRKGKCALIGLLMGLMFNTQAEDMQKLVVDPQDAKIQTSSGQGGFVPIPQIISEPAVGYGLGAVGLYFHETSQQQSGSEDPMPENISLVAGGLTENGTWVAGLGHMGFWFNDALRYRGFGGYGDLNLTFYSLAGKELLKPVKLNIAGPAIFQELKYRVRGPWFVGVQQQYRHTETQLQVDLAVLDEDLDPDIQGWLDNNLQLTQTTSGLGLMLEYDTIDNLFNPRTGADYRMRYMWFREPFGSDVDYTQYQLKALNYWLLTRRVTLGLRLQYEGVDADDLTQLPNYVLPSIHLRGVSATRFQGIVVGVMEAEAGYQLTPYWRFSVFSGVGRTGGGFSALGSASSVVSRGFGVRYQLLEQYDFNVGVDIASGPEETALYIQAGSTW